MTMKFQNISDKYGYFGTKRQQIFSFQMASQRVLESLANYIRRRLSRRVENFPCVFYFKRRHNGNIL